VYFVAIHCDMEEGFLEASSRGYPGSCHEQKTDPRR
jgi:hypothetical protein